MAQYAVWDDIGGKIVLGPTNLPLWWIDAQGTRHNGLNTMTEAQLNLINWYRVENHYIGLEPNNLEFKILSPAPSTREGNVIKVNQNLTWKPLEEICDIKTNIIDNYRQDFMNGGITYGTVQFDSNQNTINNFTGISTAINTFHRKGWSFPEPIKWIGAKNITYDLTVDEFDGLTLAVVTFIETCWRVGRFHKDNVLLLSDEQSIIDYDYLVGWPSNDLGGTIASLG